jgi:hypothetical protein
MVVSALFERLGVDALALGEVTPDALERLRPPVFRELKMFREDRTNVRVGMLYNAAKIGLLNHHESQTRYAGKTLIRGFQLDIALLETDSIACLFVVHWPSRLFASQKRERHALGTDLQRQIDSIRREFGQETPIVAMGDFNDEPFDQSISEGLLGTRDRALARKKPDLLYNPFWRWLGERRTLAQEIHGRLAAGTHYYRSDQLTNWFTFDQILVSASLLKSEGWIFHEEGTGVWPDPCLLKDGGIVSGFDHLPIFVTLVRVDNQDKEL